MKHDYLDLRYLKKKRESLNSEQNQDEFFDGLFSKEISWTDKFKTSTKEIFLLHGCSSRISFTSSLFQIKDEKEVVDEKEITDYENFNFPDKHSSVF